MPRDRDEISILINGQEWRYWSGLSVNLALDLARQGYRTCLFDADLGLANVNILLGIYPEHSLEDLILKRKRIDEILIRDDNGVDIIPGSSGIES